MARLHLLGTGSGLLNPERNASSYLLETAGGDILFDCGEPVAATLARRGYAWERLRAIVLTHTHADHLGGFPMLMQQLHLSRRTNGLALVLPAELAAQIKSLLGMYYLFMESFTFAVEIRESVAGERMALGAVGLLPVSTSHLEHARAGLAHLDYPNTCSAFAYAVEVEGVNWLYSGDLGSFDDIREHLATAQLAVVDSTHVGLTEVLDWAVQHPTCRLLLSHVSPHFDLEACRVELERRGLRQVRLAADGDCVDLG